MKKLLTDIRNCSVCEAHLPLGPNPIVSAHPNASIIIIGQAPGTKVHKTSVPWDDPSGKQLRKWMGITETVFYNPSKIAIMPMGFCYPGKGKTGDLPPRPECAPLWHEQLLKKMPNIQLTILIGQYAQKQYLRNTLKRNLTETVKAYKEYAPSIFTLPHPSPRNRFWLAKNPWFEQEVLPAFRGEISKMLST